MERTFGGAGRLTGDLSPELAEQLQKIFDSLGKRLGPEDLRSEGERCHDAIGEALSRLLKANLAPQSSGMDTKVMVNIPLAHLRRLPGSAALEDTWIEARTARSGWLSGPGAEAAACASEVTPVVTGTVDWDALDTLTGQWLQAAGQAPGTRLRLSRALLRLAVDAVSGPGGLAGYLRARQLGAPYHGASIPLDIGESRDIPEYMRRAVIRRDRGCAWPGCAKPPSACEPHHLIPRADGGKTEVRNLKMLCWFHHHVCVHRDGWQGTAHPDGAVTARAPWGTELRTGQPLARTA